LELAYGLVHCVATAALNRRHFSDRAAANRRETRRTFGQDVQRSHQGANRGRHYLWITQTGNGQSSALSTLSYAVPRTASRFMIVSRNQRRSVRFDQARASVRRLKRFKNTVVLANTPMWPLQPFNVSLQRHLPAYTLRFISSKCDFETTLKVCTALPFKVGLLGTRNKNTGTARSSPASRDCSTGRGRRVLRSRPAHSRQMAHNASSGVLTTSRPEN